jgi:hypothetical protein
MSLPTAIVIATGMACGTVLLVMLGSILWVLWVARRSKQL